MTQRFDPINPKCPHMLHGGDYNPDQWMRTPEIWDEDMRLMKRAGCNAMSIGIFSWSALEPAEGRFECRVRVVVLARETQVSSRRASTAKRSSGE